MRTFLDTEHDKIVTETELAAEFQPSENFPHFNNWLREIAGKNGTLEEVTEMKNITREMAKEFWRDLMGTLWGDANCKATHGIMSAGLIADHMRITTERTNAFLLACAEYGITERQGGGWVV